jgi:hypothetical protein
MFHGLYQTARCYNIEERTQHHGGRQQTVSDLKMESVRSSKGSINFTRLHGVTSYKNAHCVTVEVGTMSVALTELAQREDECAVTCLHAPTPGGERTH